MIVYKLIFSKLTNTVAQVSYSDQNLPAICCWQLKYHHRFLCNIELAFHFFNLILSGTTEQISTLREHLEIICKITDRNKLE